MFHGCELCEKKYVTLKFFAKHYRKSHDSTYSLWFIYECNEFHGVFMFKILLRKHLMSIHKDASIRPIQRVKKSKMYFSSYAVYTKHLTNYHNLDVVRETLQFTSYISGFSYMDGYHSRSPLYGRMWFFNITSGKRTKFGGSIKIGSTSYECQVF